MAPHNSCQHFFCEAGFALCAQDQVRFRRSLLPGEGPSFPFQVLSEIRCKFSTLIRGGRCGATRRPKKCFGGRGMGADGRENTFCSEVDSGEERHRKKGCLSNVLHFVFSGGATKNALIFRFFSPIGEVNLTFFSPVFAGFFWPIKNPDSNNRPFRIVHPIHTSIFSLDKIAGWTYVP